MIRRPVITSLLIAGGLAIVAAAVMLSTTRNVDEKPFVIYFTLVAFPFAWFFVWVILGTIAWWQSLFEADTHDEGSQQQRKPNGTDSAT
jgi:Na+/H+ antiporter NhaC